ncbi:MAG: outer membrane beta-barrel protein [Bacteroidales bacterium]|nr:outer membrane beta-barrel protein [Bacteroidales bacterium]
MKKLLIVLAAVIVSAAAVSAQDREISLDRIEDLNKREISKSGSNVRVSLSLAFPMQFGWSVLSHLNYKGDWAGYASEGMLDTRTGGNFVYGLEMAGVHFKSANGPLHVSLGLRWTFMDFTFSHPEYTIRPVGGDSFDFIPIKTENPNYDYNKSKVHATYFGIPLRASLHFGRAAVFAGASAELLTGGYAKYKRPDNRMQIKEVFHPFRATVEAGFNYGLLGFYVQYALTPLFKQTLSDANTFTFGLVLGL